MITSFVMIMMLVIEYVNVQSKGSWSANLRKSRITQIVFASIIGVFPGCFGAYLIVSLYTHSLISFGAITAAMLASFGDEAYVLFSLAPMQGLKLSLIIVTIAIVVGIIVDFITKGRNYVHNYSGHMHVHEVEILPDAYKLSSILKQLKKLSFERAILIFGLLLFIFALLTGWLADEHGHASVGTSTFITSTFIFFAVLALFIVVVMPDHFLQDHLWGHIVKNHFMRIFLWTFVALFGIELLMNFIDLSKWLSANPVLVLTAALLVGIIPQSGPHLIFITLFVQGSIPFSILLANSIVQDGHGGLPLLAESKKSFVLIKAVNLLVGLIVGVLGMYFHF